MRAFEDEGCDYYKLTQSLGEGLLPAGAIFYHDKSDHVRGSISEGCLKLCWTPESSTYGPLAGDTVVFHAYFIKTDLFELVYRGTGFDVKRLDELKGKLEQIQETIEEIKKEIDELLGK